MENVYQIKLKDNAGHVNDTVDEMNGDIRAVNLSRFQEKAEIHQEIQNDFSFVENLIR